MTESAQTLPNEQEHPLKRSGGSVPLQNPRHEKFCLGVVAGKSLKQAYVDSGYTDGHPAYALASRLATKDKIAARIAYLTAQLAQKQLVTQAALSIRHRSQRLDSLQQLSDRHMKLIDARSRGEAGLETGLVVRRLKSIGNGDNAQVVEEYLYDGKVVEETRNIGRQAAEELGEWSQRVVVEQGNSIAARSLADTLTLDELEELERKIIERSKPVIDISPARIEGPK